MFRLFGFPVHVRIGFVLFLGLLALLWQSSVGYWLVGGIAVFTLIHELGHAIVARSFGADAEISLSFMAGYTSYRIPGPSFNRGRRALVSVAGPAVQIITGVIALVALREFAADTSWAADARFAVWWAGPVIGVLNLIPVLPLDGGHLVENLIGAIARRDLHRQMVIASLVITGAVAIWMYVSGNRNFTIFVAFLLFSQFQMLQATMSPTRRRPSPG